MKTSEASNHFLVYPQMNSKTNTLTNYEGLHAKFNAYSQTDIVDISWVCSCIG